MNNSKRRDSYMNQLLTFKPTKTVVILHNEGFKNCKKPKWVSNSAFDLWHANKEIFTLTQDLNEPILVLEDDIEFLPFLKKFAPSIENFIKRKDIEAYSLGCIPYLSVPWEKEHIRSFLTGTAHAVIYTPQARKKMNKKFIRLLHDVEILPQLKTYTSRIPCAIQEFSPTENSMLWDPLGIFRWYIKLFPDSESFFSHQHRLSIVGGMGGLTILIIIISIIIILSIFL
tara:strand:+ start:472 stop:1155 length:684 start_codon:yes stop_codon:yes gene_type:complete